MNKIIRIISICLLLTLLGAPVYATEYRFDAPDVGLFGRPTSDETIYVGTDENQNIDRSKNSAYIPPVFGSPTSYLLGSGERLTPNLISASLPSSVKSGEAVNSNTVTTNPAYSEFTSVTNSLYHSDNSLGVLKIPVINLEVKVYQGTDSNTLAKGAGHFTNTSIWDGNSVFAAHNRGVNNHFGQIHTLSSGDKITLTTKLGTRTYKVYSVRQISETDNSILESSRSNMITLVTCVRNVRELRWCVQGLEVI